MEEKAPQHAQKKPLFSGINRYSERTTVSGIRQNVQDLSSGKEPIAASAACSGERETIIEDNTGKTALLDGIKKCAFKTLQFLHAIAEISG